MTKQSNKDFLNWGEISRFLVGSRFAIRKDAIPDKHKKYIDDLLDLVEDWKNSIKKKL